MILYNLKRRMPLPISD